MEKKFDSIILRKMKNNKGFTLIELLAVIVVLAIILIIAVPAIGNIIENSRRQAYLNDEKMMEKAAKTYVMKYPTTLPKEVGSKTNVLLSDMIKANVIENIKDPKDKSNNCDGYVEIEKVGDKKYNYKAYLQCGDNYATEGIVDGIIVTVPKVTDSNPGVLSGSGSSSDPYLIESIEDLVAFGQAVDEGNTYSGKYIRLEVDLDFDSINSYGSESLNEKEELKATLRSGVGFNPIGDNTEGYGFQGTFDGNDKVIKNLYINRVEGSFAALFDLVGPATIKDLGLVNVDLSGEIAAGLAITLTNSTISNIYTTGNIKGYDGSMGINYLAGVSVVLQDSTSTNVFSTTNKFLYSTESDMNVIGGLFSQVLHSSITYNYSIGELHSVSEKSTVAGGLVALMADQTNIQKSYATGDIILNRGQGGGLVGVCGAMFPCNGSTISNSYATGNVSGFQGIGGLIGGITDNMTISNSYATGNVSGVQGVGGLVGMSIGGEGTEHLTVSNSYATGNTTGIQYEGDVTVYIDPFIGMFAEGTIFENSYYYGGQICTECDGDGEMEPVPTPVPSVNATNLASTEWHTNILGWTSNWSFTNGKYPLIKKDATTLLGGQTLISTP